MDVRSVKGLWDMKLGREASPQHAAVPRCLLLSFCSPENPFDVLATLPELLDDLR